MNVKKERNVHALPLFIMTCSEWYLREINILNTKCKNLLWDCVNSFISLRCCLPFSPFYQKQANHHFSTIQNLGANHLYIPLKLFHPINSDD